MGRALLSVRVKATRGRALLGVRVTTVMTDREDHFTHMPNYVCDCFCNIYHCKRMMCVLIDLQLHYFRWQITGAIVASRYGKQMNFLRLALGFLGKMHIMKLGLDKRCTFYVLKFYVNKYR